MDYAHFTGKGLLHAQIIKTHKNLIYQKYFSTICLKLCPYKNDFHSHIFELLYVNLPHVKEVCM